MGCQEAPRVVIDKETGEVSVIRPTVQKIDPSNNKDMVAFLLGMYSGLGKKSGSKEIVTHTFSNPNQRHFASKVNQKSIAKDQNTVIESWVDVTGDINTINAGNIQRVENTFTVNGRTYGTHDNAIFPISGVGFHSLDRGGYRALGVYNTFGNTNKATQYLDNMKTTKETREAALKVWEVLQK